MDGSMRRSIRCIMNILHLWDLLQHMLIMQRYSFLVFHHLLGLQLCLAIWSPFGYGSFFGKCKELKLIVGELLKYFSFLLSLFKYWVIWIDRKLRFEKWLKKNMKEIFIINFHSCRKIVKDKGKTIIKKYKKHRYTQIWI